MECFIIVSQSAQNTHFLCYAAPLLSQSVLELILNSMLKLVILHITTVKKPSYKFQGLLKRHCYLD